MQHSDVQATTESSQSAHLGHEHEGPGSCSTPSLLVSRCMQNASASGVNHAYCSKRTESALMSAMLRSWRSRHANTRANPPATPVIWIGCLQWNTVPQTHQSTRHCPAIPHGRSAPLGHEYCRATMSHLCLPVRTLQPRFIESQQPLPILSPTFSTSILSLPCDVVAPPAEG